MSFRSRFKNSAWNRPWWELFHERPATSTKWMVAVALAVVVPFAAWSATNGWVAIAVTLVAVVALATAASPRHR